MSDPHDTAGDAESERSQDLARLAQRLRQARPVPTPAFVARVRRAVIDTGTSEIETPSRLRARIAAYALAGTLLLLLGVLGAAGVGPLGG